MTTTYAGPAGRIIGFTWGIVWFGVGIVASIVVGDNFGFLPAVVERYISESAPVLLTLAETGQSSIAVGLFFWTVCRYRTQLRRL